MTNELEDLLNKIQRRDKLTLEQIANRIGYSRPHLNREKKAGGNPKLIGTLKEEFAETLQNITDSSGAGASDIWAKQAIANLTYANKVLAESVAESVANNTVLINSNNKLMSLLQANSQTSASVSSASKESEKVSSDGTAPLTSGKTKTRSYGKSLKRKGSVQS